MDDLSLQVLLNSLALLIYACSIMWILLNIEFKKLSARQKVYSVVFLAVLLLLNLFAQLLLGTTQYRRYYLFITQLPVYLIFLMVSPYRGIKLLFVLLTAVFLSAPVISMMIIVRQFFKPYFIIQLCGYLIMLKLVHRFFKEPFHYFLDHAENRILLTFINVPLLYYIYTYASTQYQFTAVSANTGFFIRQIPLLIVLTSYILLIQIYKTISETHALQNMHNMMEMQLNAATAHINQLKASQEQAAIYRHDLRYHLNYLRACISENNLKDSLAYISEVCEDMDSAKITRFSENESVNLILSAYVIKAAEKKICSEINVSTADFGKFGVPDLCSLLSNAFENAIYACETIADSDKRCIKLRMYSKNSKLCIDIRNSYQTEPVFHQGFPVSKEQGHGLGTKSMAHVVEKYDGIYKFSVEDGSFIFQATT